MYHRRHRHFKRDFNLNNRSICPNFGQLRRNFPRASPSENKQKIKYKTENDAPITDKNRAYHRRKQTQGACLSKPLIHIDPPASIKTSISTPRSTSPRCAIQMDNPRWRLFGVQPPDYGDAVGRKIGGGSFAQAGGARVSSLTTTGAAPKGATGASAKSGAVRRKGGGPSVCASQIPPKDDRAK